MTKVDNWQGIPFAIDRGVVMRSHPTMNMDILMYIDDPGIYFDAHGNILTDSLAEAAGFDVSDLSRKHKIKQALRKAEQQVLEEFGAVEKTVVAEREGFTVRDIGLGRYQVHGPDGALLTNQPISKDHALVLLDNLAPPDDKAPKKAK